MDAQVWAQICKLVEGAASLPPDQRAAFLLAESPDEGSRLEAQQLLAFETDADAIFTVGARPWDFTSITAEESMTGEQLGSYRLLQELGRGGMGAVYLAERADGSYQHRVAVKLLQESIFTPRLAARFAEERQILARLSHPGIARLLDGGVSSNGRPYLVLEYVEGARIDDFCETRRLDVRARLHLFLEVADAVQSAHQQLVLHLDLKPANILVTPAGAPRLLDFGIARVLGEGQAQTSQVEATIRLLTPRYASPEQAAGYSLGVASDVFSLATLLYKLLTGRLPYALDGASPLEAARMIREEPPLMPSKAASGAAALALRGDLDTILLLALRKEPERRYATVAAFAADIQRYLVSKPVSAHADSFRYRAAKFVRRNRRSLAVASLALVVMLASVGAVIRAAVVARRADAAAERRLKDERELAHSYLFDLDPMLKEIPHTVPVRAFILKHALKYLDTISQESIGDDDLAREVASGYLSVEQVQADPAEPSMNDRAGAWASIGRSYAIEERLFNRNPADLKQRGLLLKTVRLMGFLAGADGDLRLSEELEQQAWQLGQPIIAAGPSQPRFQTMISVAWDLANNRGGNGGSPSFADPVGALPWLDQMHRLTLIFRNADPSNAARKTDVAEYLEREAVTRGGVLMQLGRFDEAGVQFAESVRLAQEEVSQNLVESEAQLVQRFNYADFLLKTHQPRAAQAMSPPLPAPLPLTASDHSEISQRADVLGQEARIDLQSGRLAVGRIKMQEALRDFEAIYQADPSDATSSEELASTCMDIAGEAALDRQTRQQLYGRAIQLMVPFVQKHPEALSVTLDMAKAHLGLASLAAPADRHKQAQMAWDGATAVLAAHPLQPDASGVQAAAQDLLRP